MRKRWSKIDMCALILKGRGDIRNGRVTVGAELRLAQMMAKRYTKVYLREQLASRGIFESA